MDALGARWFGLSVAALVTSAHVMLLTVSWLPEFGGPGAPHAAADSSLPAFDWLRTCAKGYAFGASPCSWEAALPRAPAVRPDH